VSTTTTEDLKVELGQLVSDVNFWKETPSTYGFAFVIKNCQHGGTTASRNDFPTYEIAVWEALQIAKEITAQGFHYHGGTKRYKN
jgi:hypothetical protein